MEIAVVLTKKFWKTNREQEETEVWKSLYRTKINVFIGNSWDSTDVSATRVVTFSFNINYIKAMFLAAFHYNDTQSLSFPWFFQNGSSLIFEIVLYSYFSWG